MQFFPSPFIRALLAGSAVALGAWAPSAQALAVATNHLVTADTSISERVREIDRPQDGVLFDRSVASSGLGSQGQVSSASATQSVFFDADHGAFGSGTASLALSGGVSGEAESSLQGLFDIAQRSTFSVTALFEGLGNASATADLRLVLFGDDDLVQTILDVDQATPSVDVTGFLDPGAYLLFIGSKIASADPGESGSSRFEFNFRFDAVEGSNPVPEPSSLALVIGALVASRFVGRRSRH